MDASFAGTMTVSGFGTERTLPKRDRSASQSAGRHARDHEQQVPGQQQAVAFRWFRRTPGRTSATASSADSRIAGRGSTRASSMLAGSQGMATRIIR